MSTSFVSIKSLFESGQPLPLYRTEQIRAAELAFAQAHGKPFCAEATPDPQTSGTWPLMQRAGEAAFELFKHRWPEANKLAVVCGKGNNAGDGYVFARLAVEAGLDVYLIRLCEASAIKGDALIAWRLLSPLNFKLIAATELKAIAPDLIIDALLGTGFKGELQGDYREVVRQINQSPCPKLAIDIPSGLEANTGVVKGDAVTADATITYIGLKQGLMTADAFDYCGELWLADLQVECDRIEDIECAVKAYRWPSVKNWIPKRRFNSHKGDYGHTLIIGGSNGMLGAAILAAEASVRGGSGKTSAWVERDAAMIVCRRPEVMARNLAPVEIPQLIENGQHPDSLVIGPGLGQSDWSRSVLAAVVDSPWWQKCFKVIDADALNWLAQTPFDVTDSILTPHPGEAARLLKVSTKEINENRFESALAIAGKFRAICILKGAGTVIASPNGDIAVCPVGHPRMATGGMGDVLSGLLGSLVKRFDSRFYGVVFSVCLHGTAAERINLSSNKLAVLPSDILQKI